MEKEKNKVLKLIVSFVFLIWFVTSLVFIVYFAKKDQAAMSVMIAGQYFLVFGIIAVVSGITSKSFNPISLIFPVVGIGMMAGGFVYHYGSSAAVELLEKYLPDLFLVIFFVAGVLMITVSCYSTRKKRTDCTYVIMATCVDVDTQYRKGSRSYCPTYEIYYRGETLRLCDHLYTNMDHITVGEQREVHINPDEPTEFFEEKREKMKTVFMCSMGTAFAVISLFALYMYHFV
jgi:hypothetical protein